MRTLLCVLLSAGLVSCADTQGPSNADSLLVLRTDDIEKARLTVLTVAEKRGQLVESRLDSGIESQFTARIRIPASAYYATVKEIGGAGRLVSEKTKAALPPSDQDASNSAGPPVSGAPASQTTPAPGTPGTESAETAKADNKSRMMIEVRITGPGAQEGLKIPAFREALIGVINAILGLAYVAIWISPLLILYGLYRLLRKKGKNKPAPPAPAPAANKSGNPVTLD